MAEIAKLMVKIDADITGLKTSMEQVNSSISTVKKNIENVDKTVQAFSRLEVGSALTSNLTKPIIGIGISAVKSAADFEQGMSNIKALTGATGSEMKNLQDLALKMGADTKYSATEAALGIEELMKAGLSTQQVMEGGLDGALSLATAGELELADAAEIASTALNSFKNDNLSVSDAANILAGAANASATDVSELKYGLSASATVAAGLGLTFKDTSTALALFAQNGLKGSDAGTSLKTMLSNLVPKTSAQIGLFEELGITTNFASNKFFDANGNIQSMASIAGTLQNALAGMTSEQRQSAMYTLFGSDAIRAGNILFKEGAIGIENMASAMSKVTAADVAKEKMNNLNGAIEQFMGSIETMGINIGTRFIPIITRISEIINMAVNGFMNLSPSIQNIVLVVLGLVAAIGPLLVIIGGISTILPIISAGFAAIASPITLIVIGIAGLIAALTYLYKTNDDIRNFIDSTWKFISDFLIVSFNLIKISAIYIFDTLSVFWKKHGEDIIGFFKTSWTIIKAFLEPIFNTIKSIAIIIFKDLEIFWNKWGSTIKSIFTNYFELIFSITKNTFNNIKSFWNEWGGVITTLFTASLNTVRIVFEGAWKQIQTVVKTALGILDGIIKIALGLIKGNWGMVWDGIKQIVSSIFTGIIETITNSFNTLTKLFGNIAKTIKKLFDDSLISLQDFIENIITKIITKINQIITSIQDIITTIGSKISSLIENIKSTIINGVDSISSSFETIKSKITNAWDSIVNLSKNWGSNLVNMIANGISSAAGAVSNAVSKIASNIKSTLGFGSPTEEGACSNSDEWAPNFIYMFANGLINGIPKINKATKEIADSIYSNLGNLNANTSLDSAVNVNSNYKDKISSQQVSSLENTTAQQLASAVGSAILASNSFNKTYEQKETNISLNLNGTTFAKLLLPYLNNEEQRLGKPLVNFG